MSFHPRKDIVAKVLERFATITTANGYQTNIGAGLKRWFVTALDPAQLPALIVNDGKFVKNQDDPNSGKHTWELEFFANIVLAPPATLSDNNHELATMAIEDIYKAIGVDPRWGSLARRTDEVSDEIRVDKEGTRVGGGQVIFKVITSRKPFEA
jgi:hypothetical protein